MYSLTIIKALPRERQWNTPKASSEKGCSMTTTSTVQRHGLSIGIERINDAFFIVLKAVGTLTHEDYEVITPLLDSALGEVTHPKVKALIDGTEMEGWELRAAWDDFKIGLRHGNEFEKIAIYGNKGWQEITAKVGGWFLSGEVRYFEDRAEALAWLEA